MEGAERTERLFWETLGQWPSLYLRKLLKARGRSSGKDIEKLEPLCTVNGNVKWYSHYSNSIVGSSD